MGLILALLKERELERELKCFDLSLCMVTLGTCGKVPRFWTCAHALLSRGSQNQAVV